MTKSASQLEQEIAETRARLDGTIGAIQDRLTLSGMIDELIGSVQGVGFNSAVGKAVGTAKRNPLPLMIAAAGVGWLLHRMGQKGTLTPFAKRPPVAEPELPGINMGHARVYNPDMSSRHPHHDSLESRREQSAHA